MTLGAHTTFRRSTLTPPELFVSFRVDGAGITPNRTYHYKRMAPPGTEIRATLPPGGRRPSTARGASRPPRRRLWPSLFTNSRTRSTRHSNAAHGHTGPAPLRHVRTNLQFRSSHVVVLRVPSVGEPAGNCIARLAGLCCKTGNLETPPGENQSPTSRRGWCAKLAEHGKRSRETPRASVEIARRPVHAVVT
jgi:hypothetical protein